MGFELHSDPPKPRKEHRPKPFRPSKLRTAINRSLAYVQRRNKFLERLKVLDLELHTLQEIADKMNREGIVSVLGKKITASIVSDWIHKLK